MNPIKLSYVLQETLTSYLTTTFDVNRDENELELANALRRSFTTPGALFNGPFLELTPPYQTGQTLEDFVAQGILSPKLLELDCFKRGNPIPPDIPLYSHQETAIKKLCKQDENVVISSGTGSGKTEGFLIPILNDLLLDDTPGVRAVIIYPMNALVNDQLARLRDLLKGTNITFGRYTGETKQKELDARKELIHRPLPNEIICRDQIQVENKLPQILITNYAMLEYLLLRPEDAPLFNSGPWKFIVLDEAHTHAGARGIEVGLLIRRLKHRLKKIQGQTRCIATSATLTNDDAIQAAGFASSLFGEEFTIDDIIFGEVDPDYVPTDSESYSLNETVYLDEQFENLLTEIRQETGKNTDEIALQLYEMGLISETQLSLADQFVDPTVFLWQVLKGNQDLTRLRNWIAESGGPVSVEKAAKHLFGSRLSQREAEQALYHLIELGAMARPAPDKPSLFPARYHLFARAPQGIWVCLNPNCSGKQHSSIAGWSRLFASPREHCDSCGCNVYPLTVCRTCGQVYVRMEEEGRLFLAEAPKVGDATPHYFTWTRIDKNLALAEVDDEEEIIAATPVGSTMLQERKVICLNCQQEMKKCNCTDGGVHVTLFWVAKQVVKGGKRKVSRIESVTEMTECFRCHDTPKIRGTEIVTSISLSSFTPLSIMTNALYRELPAASNTQVKSKPGEGRKLLSFYDSRQGAARFASFLQDAVNQQIYRHIIPKAVDQILSQKNYLPDLYELSLRCTANAWDYRIFHNDSQITDLSQNMSRMSSAQENRLSTIIAKQVVAEFSTRRRDRQSLEMLGLVGVQYFEPHSLPDFEPLAKKLGINTGQTRQLIEYLLDGLRQAKVIDLPQGVNPDDEVFGRNRFSPRLVRTNPQSYEVAWIGKTPRQRRRRLIEKILRSCGLPASEENVIKALEHIFYWLIEPDMDLMIGDSAKGYQLRSDRFFFQTDGDWYQCDQCRRLSCRGNALICPHPYCNGNLVPADVSALRRDNFYYRIFTQELIPVRVEEHTAQLDPIKGGEYQNLFKNGDINVLSCSTTFEMGIDLGDLQAVVMSNIPPTVSNYKQRAGRAGRRTSGTAFILAWASERPHDQTYFSEPFGIISGQVRVPHLALSNKLITQRHINAIILSAFLRHQKNSGRDDLSKVGSFFDVQIADDPHFIVLETWIKDNYAQIYALLETFSPNNNEVSLSTLQDWVDVFLTDMRQKGQDVYENVGGYYQQTIQEAVKAVSTASNSKEINQATDTIKQYQKLLDRLRDDNLINYLSERGVLPSYSFPLHTVELMLPPFRKERLRLQRDLRQAIREYAPGQEIVADKRIWRSEALQFYRKTPLIFHYRICEECNHLRKGSGAGIELDDPFGACPVCGAMPSKRRLNVYRYVQPDGFRASNKSGMPAGQYVHFQFNLMRSALLPGEVINSDPVGEIMMCGYDRNGSLLYVNEGVSGQGFRICLTCGKSLGVKTKKCDGKYRGQACPGDRVEVVTLGFEQRTDTLHLSFNSSPHVSVPAPENNSFWNSLLYAFLQGASRALQIERRDIDGVLFPRAEETGWRQTIVLYDNVPGGAGHVRQILDEISLVIEESLRIANCVDCAPDTSCYHCLRDYSNQSFHSQLRRGPVARFLEAVLASLNETDDDVPGLGQVVAINTPRWLMQQISQTERELILVAGEITRLSPPGEGKMWLDVIQELLVKQVKVRLYLTSEFKLDRKNSENLSIARHLQLLLDYGLELFETKSKPDWGVIIDANGSTPRAVKSSKNKPLCLNDNLGNDRFLSTIQSSAVNMVYERFDRISAHPILAQELNLPPEIKVINLPLGVSGQSLTERTLFAEVFEEPVQELFVNDRYLLSEEQIYHRLGAYVELANNHNTLKKVIVRTYRAGQGTVRNSPSIKQDNAIKKLQRRFGEVVIEFKFSHTEHDRFIVITRPNGTQARILIGKGLDFIRSDGMVEPTYVIIEDPYRSS